MITSLSACPITFPLNPLLKRWPVMLPTFLNSSLQLQNISQGSDIFSQIYILTLTLIVPTHWSLQLFEGQRKSMLTQSVVSCPCVLLIYKPFYILPMAHSLMMTSFLLPSCPAFSMPATILASWCRKIQKTSLTGEKLSSVPPSLFHQGKHSIIFLIRRGTHFIVVLTSCSHIRRLLTLSHFSMSMSNDVTLFMVPALLFSYEKTAPTLLAHAWSKTTQVVPRYF